MTNTKKVVFAKLFSKPANTKLSKTRKLKLSVVDDIESNVNWLEESYSEASYYAYERWDEVIERIDEYRSEIGGEVDNIAVNGQGRSLDEAGSNMLELLATLEKGAEDLGVDPAELLDNYEEIKDMAQNAQETYEAFVEKYKEVVEYSGFLATFLSKTPKKKKWTNANNAFTIWCSIRITSELDGKLPCP